MSFLEFVTPASDKASSTIIQDKEDIGTNCSEVQTTFANEAASYQKSSRAIFNLHQISKAVYLRTKDSV